MRDFLCIVLVYCSRQIQQDKAAEEGHDLVPAGLQAHADGAALRGRVQRQAARRRRQGHAARIARHHEGYCPYVY